MGSLNKILLMTLIFISLPVIACSHKIQAHKSPPHKSFVKIYKTIDVSKCKEGSKLCKTSEFGALGSGVSIHQTDTSTYFLTAAHVCRYYLPKDFKKEVLEYSSRTILEVHTGKFHEAEIFSISDIKKDGVDLCILKAPRLNIQPVKISQTQPQVGDLVFSLAAPAGIYHPPTVPIFQGLYSGDMPDLKNSMTTIPAIGGSSGAPILNLQMEVVGVLFATHPQFPEVTIVSNLKETAKFLNILNVIRECKE